MCESSVVRAERFDWSPPLGSPRPTTKTGGHVSTSHHHFHRQLNEYLNVQSYVMLVIESLSSFDLPIYMLDHL